MKSEKELAENQNQSGQPNIPGPQELPDQQKVGEPNNDQSAKKPKSENNKKTGADKKP